MRPASLICAILLTAAQPAWAGGADDGEKVLLAAADVIMKSTKNKRATVMADLSVVRDAVPKLREAAAKAKLPQREAYALAAVAWKGARGVYGSAPKKFVLKADEPLKYAAFVASTGGYGHLVVTSIPEGAKVTVGAIVWGPTKTNAWEEAGVYKVRVEKDGYEPSEQEVRIVAGESRPHDVRLKKKR